MSPSLAQPQGQLSPAEAMQLAQQAPAVLRSNPKGASTSPLQILFASPETPELWTIYETLLLSCLRTGDDEAAHQCLERLVLRFGEANQRIMALKGLVKEAEAKDQADLDVILKEYDSLLEDDGANIPISKRKAALLRSMGKIPESINSLTALLDFSPTDAEAWAELADLYMSQGLYGQAIFALEEVLLITPNAWNIHALLGEASLMAAKSSEGPPPKHLAEALKRFCRSVELCDDYLRGYYGLKLVTDRLLTDLSRTKKNTDAEGFAFPDQKTIERLNQTATKKLGEIVRRYTARDPLWQGYDAAEIDAARRLIADSTSETVR